MKNWLRKRREAFANAVAKEVIKQLETSRGWQKFLPPVALRDCIYLVTENGNIYRLHQDASGMDMLMQIHRN